MKLLWSHTDAIKVTSYIIIITSTEAGQKKSKLKPKKREDRLDKDGEAAGVSSMMLSVPIFQYHGVTQSNLKCLVGHMTHFNLYF